MFHLAKTAITSAALYSLQNCTSTLPANAVEPVTVTFQNVTWNQETCSTVLNLGAFVTNYLEDYGSLNGTYAYVDFDGTSASEQITPVIDESCPLSQQTRTALAYGSSKQSQNSIIFGSVAATLTNNNYNLNMIYSTGNATSDAANIAALNNYCEQQSSGDYDKFFLCIGTRTAGMSTTQLSAIHDATLQTFSTLVYFNSQNALNNYLYYMGVTIMYQSGGTLFPSIAMAYQYPQPWNEIYRSEQCDYTKRTSAQMLPWLEEGCPIVSDSPQTAPGSVFGTPNTRNVCGKEIGEMSPTEMSACVDNAAGKASNMKFLCSTYAICPTFFFGNSGGDIYPANDTIAFARRGITRGAFVGIHNNPSICNTLNPEYNSSTLCNNINDANQTATSIIFNEASCAALIAAYATLINPQNQASHHEGLSLSMIIIISVSVITGVGLTFFTPCFSTKEGKKQNLAGLIAAKLGWCQKPGGKAFDQPLLRSVV